MKAKKVPEFVILSGKTELATVPYMGGPVTYTNTTDYTLVVTGAVLRYPGFVDVQVTPGASLNRLVLVPGDSLTIDQVTVG